LHALGEAVGYAPHQPKGLVSQI